MELPSPLTSWVNPFPSRVINRTIFFCNALESHECAYCLLSFLYFHWLFPLSARETSSGNRSIYKSTRERVDSKGLCGRWRLHLMGSCGNQDLISEISIKNKYLDILTTQSLNMTSKYQQYIYKQHHSLKKSVRNLFLNISINSCFKYRMCWLQVMKSILRWYSKRTGTSVDDRRSHGIVSILF